MVPGIQLVSTHADATAGLKPHRNNYQVRFMATMFSLTQILPPDVIINGPPFFLIKRARKWGGSVKYECQTDDS